VRQGGRDTGGQGGRDTGGQGGRGTGREQIPFPKGSGVHYCAEGAGRGGPSAIHSLVPKRHHCWCFLTSPSFFLEENKFVSSQSMSSFVRRQPRRVGSASTQQSADTASPQEREVTFQERAVTSQERAVTSSTQQGAVTANTQHNTVAATEPTERSTQQNAVPASTQQREDTSQQREVTAGAPQRAHPASPPAASGQSGVPSAGVPSAGALGGGAHVAGDSPATWQGARWHRGESRGLHGHATPGQYPFNRGPLCPPSPHSPRIPFPFRVFLPAWA